MKKDEKRKSNHTALIWGGTGFVVMVIIGISLFVALNGHAPESSLLSLDPVTQEVSVTAQPKEYQAVLPEAQEKVVSPSSFSRTEMPDRKAASGVQDRPQLRLDTLAGTLNLHVPFMDVRDKMPLEHTCFRRNISPEINWKGTPAGTKSFVVFMEKREGGTESFVNWILFDIPETVEHLANAQPQDAVLSNGAKHARSDHHNIGYIGPCDSKGEFQYVLRIFALDKMLELPPHIGKYDLIRAMNGHIIDAAEQNFTHYYRM